MSAFPEGNVAAPFDDEQRSLVKWASLLYDSGGNVPTAYPEGSLPGAYDDEERLLVKINAMRD